MTKSESLWSKKRSDWYRDAARSEIVENTYYLWPIFALGSLALLAHGLTRLDTTEGWISLACVPLILLLWRALATGREWARWALGLPICALALVSIVALVMQWVSVSEETLSEAIRSTVATSFVFFTAAVLLGPGSKERFAQARDGLPEETSAEA